MLPKETALSKLAKSTVKPVTKKPPTKVTSSPPTTIPFDDWLKEAEKFKVVPTTTTTPTTVPKVSPTVTTTTAVPKNTTATTVPVSEAEKTQQAKDALATAQAGAANIGVTKEKKKPGGFSGALSSVLNFDALGRIPGTNIDLPGSFKPAAAVIKPLIIVDTGRRAAISGFRESIDLGRELIGKGNVYTATDYIPNHKRTGKPIARIGDPVIDNWEEITSTPIAIVNNKTLENLTDAELQSATDKVVKQKATSYGASWSDFGKQIKDPSTGFGDIPYLQTGNKWIDRGIGFFGDVALDPVTYATAGGSALVKPALRGSKAGIKAAGRTVARVALEEAIASGDNVAIAAAKKAVANAEKAAITATPRRVHGAAARETAANTVREIREDALKVANDATQSAAQRTVAQKTVDVLTDDLIGDIASKGYSTIKGEAAKELGIQGGLRFGLPGFNKAAILPKITAPITDAIGQAVTLSRLNIVNTPLGASMLTKIIPLGEGGLFGSADLLQMKTRLRQGTAKGEEAADYVALLNLDKFYRGQLNINRKELGAIVSEVAQKDKWFQKNGNTLLRYLELPESKWAAEGLAPLSAEGRLAYNKLTNFFKDIFDDASRKAQTLGGPPIRPLDNYFPHVQTTRAKEWAKRNPKLAERLASDLDIDKTALLSGNYMSRNIREGKVWFNHVLTADDIAGGVKRLNQIAKDSKKISFNYFDEDLPSVLAKYANNHASFTAYIEVIGRMDKLASNIAIGTKPTGRIVTGAGAKGAWIGGLDEVQTIIGTMMNESKLLNWSTDQIEDVKNRLDDIERQLSSTSVDKREFEDAVTELGTYIKGIDEGIADKTITPPIAALLTAEAEAFATSLAQQINKIQFSSTFSSSAKWRLVSPMVTDFIRGYTKLNLDTIPNVAVKNEVLEMFKNVKRLDDKAFQKATEVLLKDYTNFLKSYVTATPGFYIRNAYGNVFAMITAGGNPANLTRGVRVFRQIQKGMKDTSVPPQKRLRKAIDVATRKLSKAEKDFIEESFAYSGATGFGQIGEVATATGAGKTGIFGKEATGMFPGAGKGLGRIRPIPTKEIPFAKRTSEILFTPLRKLRTSGGNFEEATRFALLYDGLKQGYSIEEATARVNKYLIDYQDLSILDNNIKQIIPFWMFFSRNLPLQIENMTMNPRAYQLYNNAKRNLEDKEGTNENVPDYLKEAGAFKLPFGNDLYLKPDLAFPGSGQPNVLQQIQSGNAAGVLGNLSTPFKLPIEMINNSTLYNNAPITSDSKTPEENLRRKKTYLLTNIVPALGTVGRWLTAVGVGDKVPTKIQDLTGAKLDRELQATLSFIGSPAFKLTDAQERSAMWRKYFYLKEVLQDDIDARTRRSRQDEGLLKDE